MFRQGCPGGKPWTYAPPAIFDQPLEIDLTPDTVAGHGAGVHPNLAHPGLAVARTPHRPAPGHPLHPALPGLRPAQDAGPAHPTGRVDAAGRPGGPCLRPTTGPRWPDVSGNSQATGTRAQTIGVP